ncbi:septation protein IspZ [Roseateles sp. BYS180W]|uniref:Septation protein IspZ n=1 Tax=Roseateles rivi TaxID=3299028 RepID=A0ABW7FY97_9BURK
MSSIQQPVPQPGGDFNQFKKQSPAIAVDIGLGLLFFVVGKLSDLRTAALVTAAVGLALLPIQWAINRWASKRVDLLGGLALFGVFIMLLGAGFSWYFESEFAVQLKSTVIGSIGALCFGVDALFGGRWLGQRMRVYLMDERINLRRLSAGMAAVGAVMAGVNLLVALSLSKDGWLNYTTWGDIVLAIVLTQLVLRWAAKPTLPR